MVACHKVFRFFTVPCEGLGVFVAFFTWACGRVWCGLFWVGALRGGSMGPVLLMYVQIRGVKSGVASKRGEFLNLFLRCQY
jgi:hypothetical protein